ncbi:MAG: hypothetical protein ACT6XY_13075 [Phreatobacter sp.]|jgi:hypothetical protein|uniref:hypothetical protein n=1 Tax=Phreatobacter sp. TaxID=1966341 RepID=UPI004036B544
MADADREQPPTVEQTDRTVRRGLSGTMWIVAAIGLVLLAGMAMFGTSGTRTTGSPATTNEPASTPGRTTPPGQTGEVPGSQSPVQR